MALHARQPASDSTCRAHLSPARRPAPQTMTSRGVIPESITSRAPADVAATDRVWRAGLSATYARATCSPEVAIRILLRARTAARRSVARSQDGDDFGCGRDRSSTRADARHLHARGDRHVFDIRVHARNVMELLSGRPRGRSTERKLSRKVTASGRARRPEQVTARLLHAHQARQQLRATQPRDDFGASRAAMRPSTALTAIFTPAMPRASRDFGQSGTGRISCRPALSRHHGRKPGASTAC